MHLQHTLSKFLQHNYDPTRSVLLALSGGPDSLVLFDILKRCNLDWGVAHVDHGWREESSEEASQLKEMAGEIPFHCKKIPFNASEEACRQERLLYFRELCEENGYQAVILGHHKDDQAETVLKRVLEGAAMVNMGGMSEIVSIDGLTLWRPFLNISKKQVLEWCERNGLTPFIDSTNSDPKYLRARMRTEIIPELSRSFGKEVGNSLVHLGNEVKEMRDFLDAQLKSYIDKIEITDTGSFLDLSEFYPNTPFEMKHLLRNFYREISRSQLDTATNFLLAGSANKRVGNLYVDRRRLFLITRPFDELPTKKVSLTSSLKYGSWEVSVRLLKEESKSRSYWKDVWNGNFSVTLPKNDYTIGAPHATRNNEKVPAFLKNITPVIFLDGEMYHEFLSGKIKEEPSMCKEWVEISLKRGNFIENESIMCYNRLCKGR